MNARTITEAWAAKCQVADRAGPSYKLVIESALLTAMKRAIPDLPAPAKGCEWLRFDWSALGGQTVDVEWDMHAGVSCRVYINGADITELMMMLPDDFSASLEVQAYDASMAARSEA